MPLRKSVVPGYASALLNSRGEIEYANMEFMDLLRLEWQDKDLSLVARRFAAGLSHKEVARELGISPHTVRTQLMHVYSKLSLHDKGALANYLMSQAEFGSAALAN